MLRAFDRWLIPYLNRTRRRWQEHETWHVMLAVCDHFEPFHDTDLEGARRAMAEWNTRLPDLAERYRDAAGIGYKHTFFYPVEQHHEEIVGNLADLCRRTGSEVEVHLHHHHDTAAGLEEKLDAGIADLRRLGCLGTDRDGRVRFGFIHGNWAINNCGDADGRNCGVSHELGILRRKGCYADFTMPSAPHFTQTRTINSIYYAQDTPAANSHDIGTTVKKGATAGLRDREDHLLLVQGPLGLNWDRRKWNLIPRVENAEVSGANPWSAGRWPLWLELCPSVAEGAPWIFVKLHTHGGISRNYNTLLGSPAEAFHSAAKNRLSHGAKVQLHHVTSREMVNMLHAAEDGHEGDPERYRDYLYKAPAP